MKDVVVGAFCPGRCFAALPRNLALLWGWMGAWLLRLLIPLLFRAFGAKRAALWKGPVTLLCASPALWALLWLPVRDYVGATWLFYLVSPLSVRRR